MNPQAITIDGQAYDVAHTFSATRVALSYQGAYVLADYDTAFQVWELSGEPARGYEAEVLKALIGPMDVTEVSITPPSDNDESEC